MVPADALPDCGRALKFRMPSNHLMYLFAEKKFVGKAVGVNNPDPWPDGLKGAGVHWLDHVLLICELDPEKGVNKVAENSKFFMEVLGFYLRSEEHTSELQSLMRISYAVFCLNKKTS